MKSRATDLLPVAAKWGMAAARGFFSVPNILLMRQSDLKLSDGEVITLLNLVMSWWYADQHPFPRRSTIAKRMGVDERTVRRHLRTLEAKELIRKIRPHPDEPVKYDLSGLVRKVNELTETLPQRRAFIDQPEVN